MKLIEVSFHSTNEVDLLEIEDYNPSEIDEKRNNPEIESIKIGSNLYSRIDLKNIRLKDDDNVADDS